MARKPKRAGMPIDEMARRYQAGESCAAIAAVMGTNAHAVWSRLMRSDVEMRRRGRVHGEGRLELPDSEIARRYRAGESTATIARSLGVSVNTVRGRLIEAGIERRRRGAPATRAPS